MDFSARFKQCRLKKGWTQDDVAAMLNSSRSTIAGYESHKKRRIPDTEKLLQIAKLFNVSIGYLLGEQIDLLDILEDNQTEITAGGIPLTPEQRIKILETIKSKEPPKKRIDVNTIKLSAANQDGEEVLIDLSPQLRAILDKTLNRGRS